MASTKSEMALDVFNELRLEGMLFDCVIRVNSIACNGGKRCRQTNTDFPAHKIILCGCSTYFRTLFTGSWANVTPDKNIFDVPDFPADIMRLIIDYAYTYKVSVTADNVKQLLTAADQYAVTGIVEASTDFLEGHLHPETCIGTWRVADLHSCSDLQRKAEAFIIDHFEEISLVSAEFLDLCPEELCDILDIDDLNVKGENVVYDAILRWIQHSFQDRMAHFPTLLSKVRLALLSMHDFISKVWNHELVRENGLESLIPDTIGQMYKQFSSGNSIQYFQGPLSRPRLPPTILLTVAGRDSELSNDIIAYDARADRWFKVPTPAQRPRAHHGTAGVNGYVYSIGGFDGIEVLKTMLRFDPSTCTWHEVAPMHVQRTYLSVAALGGYIYAMGGWGNSSQCSVERYDPKTDTWTIVGGMNSIRCNSSVTTLNSKIYVCGGWDHNGPLNTAECYDPTTNSWTMIAPMSSRRSAAGATAYHGRIYVAGGYDGEFHVSSVEAYDPQTDTWHSVANMDRTRTECVTGVLDGKIFVAGGFDELGTISSAECYDIKTGVWHNVHSIGTLRTSLSPCCVVPSDFLYKVLDNQQQNEAV